MEKDEKKIPLDENHTCPMCNGKGYINIVPDPIKHPFRRKDDFAKFRRLIDPKE